jgi:hypothetical protein
METNNSIYMNGKDQDIYIKWPTNLAPYDKDALNKDDMISWCWPNAKIVFPDYLNTDSHKWYLNFLKKY